MEFKISEFISDLLGKPRNAQGGSDLFYNPPVPTNDLDVSTLNSGGAGRDFSNTTTTPTTTKTTTKSGSTGTSTGTTSGTTTNPTTNNANGFQSEDVSELDADYKSLLDQYNNQLNDAQSSYNLSLIHI